MFRPVPGAEVGGRYRLQNVIGWGGMGEIWRAHDQELEGPCAVKFILGHLATDEGVRARLLREAKAAARLRSAHAVHVLGVGEHEGAMFLAMELLEGETLSTRLARGQLLSPAETVKLLNQVTHALEKAHAAGIVHRDLKPDNIWLCADHELFVKVLDFGVAKTQLSHNSKHTATGALVGTPHYMSPEQAMAEREVDHRADLWSLGIIAVECLTGKRPFEANGVAALLLKLVSNPPPSLAELAPQLPGALESWWQRALQRDPERRFQSASELVETLRRGLDTAAGVSSLPATQLEPLGSAVAAASAQQPGAHGRSNTAWGSTPSVNPLSRTHVVGKGKRRWWGVLAAGAAAAALAGGAWLALRSQSPAAAGAGQRSNLSATQAAQLPVQTVPAGTPSTAAPSTTTLSTTTPSTVMVAQESVPPQAAVPQAAVPQAAVPQATVRPISDPLPPLEASPWAPPADEAAARGPKVDKVSPTEPAARSTPVAPKPAGATRTPRPPPVKAASAARPAAASVAVDRPSTPASPEPVKAPAAATEPPAAAPALTAPRPRDLGF